MDIMWLLQPLIGKVGEDEGEGLALREKGDEILFAPFKSKPLAWVKIGEFFMLEDEGDPDHVATPIEAGTGRERPFREGVPRRERK